MKTPELDRRTKWDILDELGRLSEAYVPEWRFDPENPDAGTALAVIYGEMLEDVYRKYNQLPVKNMLEFFRGIDTSLKAAQPSSGYASFGLVNHEVEGTELRKGTRLLGSVPESGDMDVTFETVNDVYVTPAGIEEVYQILPGEDGIYHAYSRENPKEEFTLPFSFFQRRTENEQQHVLYLAHEYLLRMDKEGLISLAFTDPHGKAVDPELLQKLVDPHRMEYAYSTEEGFETFENAEVREGMICLKKAAGQPPSARREREGRELYWLRIICRDVHSAEELAVSGMFLLAEGENLQPELILAGGVEQEKARFLPFGEQMGLYEEVYFASEQAFSQKGAQIKLSFRLDFMKIPSDTYGQKQVDWKFIMKREDFIPDPEYNIEIAEVIWEYFNGNDWRRLPESRSYEKVFSPVPGTLGRRMELSFLCPMDMEPVLVSSARSCYIRARITKMDNMYRWNGQYIAPVLGDMRISFSYKRPYPVPDLAVIENNKEKSVLKKRELTEIQGILHPFLRLKEEEDTLYLGLSHPIDRGPVRYYIRLQEYPLQNKPEQELRLEYLSEKGWKELPVIDGTAGFRKTGMLTVFGNSDFARKEFWGREGCWIRIRRTEAQLSPKLTGLYGNTTEILAVETKEAEYFSIEPNQKNAFFTLTESNIYDLEVWVREDALAGNPEQLEKLKESYEIREEEAEGGVDLEIFVRWKEADSFSASGPEDRHFVIDKNQGILKFSDGVFGKIPDAGDGETIIVRYTFGGGRAGNLPKGSIQRMNDSIGYVSHVRNPVPTVGGTDRESVEQAIWRKSRALCHRERAITRRDYEALAMESAGNIVRAKCYANCFRDGSSRPGHLSIVLLLDSHYENQEAFEEVKCRCMENLCGKVPDFLMEQGRIHILPPDFVEFTVKAQVHTEDINQILDTRRRILEELKAFFHPLTGNFHGHGWQIGEIPNQMQILNLLRSVPGVLGIDRLRLLAVIRKNGQVREAGPEELEKMKFAAAAGSNFEIDITAGGNAE